MLLHQLDLRVLGLKFNARVFEESGETRFMGAKADLLAEALAELVLEVPLAYPC